MEDTATQSNPVIEAANTEAREAENIESNFESGRREKQDAVTATAAKAFDAIQKRGDETPRMPSPMAVTGKDIGAAVERASEWLDTPLDERKALAAAHGDIEHRRAEAAKLGLTLEEREAIIAAEQRQAAQAEASEFEPVKTAYRELYPEAKASEVAHRYGEIDKFIRKDPAAGIRWLAEQYGVDVAQLVQPQPMQQHQPQDVRSVVVAFANRTPDWAQLQTPILKALQSGAVPLTGDTEADLKKAYEHVKSQRPKGPPAKPKGKSSWQDVAATIERVGNQIEQR